MRALPRRPFQIREFIQQTWFIATVTILPTALVAIPFGAVIALQLGSLTRQLGAQSFTGSASVLAVLREASPIVTALLIAGAGGSAICADLGARKIRDEIDALEGMGVPSLPFLVTTPIVAGFIAVIPLYVLGLLTSYFATRTIATQEYGQSTGTYDHYFNLFLPPQDVLWSFLKVLVFAVVIILTHCYYGYRASGGPAGVGLAGGRAGPFSIVAGKGIPPFPSPGPLGAPTTPPGAGGGGGWGRGRGSRSRWRGRG